MIPTSNHNLLKVLPKRLKVVYLLIPTSNHNNLFCLHGVEMLYIFWFLHQTTTPHYHILLFHELYIFWFLHQTTTPFLFKSLKKTLYIFWFLHQTTTVRTYKMRTHTLYIFWFLHQTTTYRFEHTDFQRITNTLSNKKWWVGYNF